ncbi:MAG TPA: tetratricopeptide repeat protein [Gemmataceae bacterium]|nr:tetratricopeptide repeat protein [Gemmataceae bacterium]
MFHNAEELQQQDQRSQAEQGFREAASWASKALALKPDHAFAHIYLGLSLKQLGQRAAALDALRRAVDCAPGLMDAHMHLGEALAELGRHIEAVAHLRQAERLAQSGDTRPAEALARLQQAKRKESPR